MRKFSFFCLFMFSGLLFSSPALSTKSKIEETGEYRSDLEHTVYSNLCGEINDRVICVDGFKVFQTVAYGFCNDGGGAAVSNIQLYEDKDGRVVPARCVPRIIDPKK